MGSTCFHRDPGELRWTLKGSEGVRYIPRGFDWIPMDSDGIPMGSAALQWHSIVFSGFHGIPTAFNVILMNPVSEHSRCPSLDTSGAAI